MAKPKEIEQTTEEMKAEMDSLKAQLKKATLNSKYKPINEVSDDFDATDFLFSDARDDAHKKEVVTSDLPARMPPLLTNWETLIEATDIKSRLDENGDVIRLSRRWISKYLLYRKPVDRQARNEAITMGQERQEQDMMKGAMKA
jgi:hypothetical protein